MLYIVNISYWNSFWAQLQPVCNFYVCMNSLFADVHEFVSCLCLSVCVFDYVLSMLQDARFLASQSNEILTAIVQGMRKEEQSNRVKLAATKALLNSLEFTKANFEKEVCLPTLTPYPFTLPPPHLTPPPLSSLLPWPHFHFSLFCLGGASFYHASRVWGHPV